MRLIRILIYIIVGLIGIIGTIIGSGILD